MFSGSWKQYAKQNGKTTNREHEHKFSKYSLIAYVYHPKVRRSIQNYSTQ